MPRASKAVADSAKTASTTAEKKPAEKPAAKRTKKACAPKVEMFVEFNSIQASADTILENVKATYAAEGGTAEIKTLKVYVKPEENAAYYVVNEEDARRMDVYFL